MTDAEINKAVAERVMGHAVYGGFTWTLPDKKLVHCGVVDYCGDPAAWGGLYDWLRAHEWEVSLIARGVGTTEARVRHHHARGYFGMAEDAETGRALALAALRAYGVEV